MKKAKIEIRNLHKSFGSNRVLCGINLEIAAGESVVVMGGSGTGKSVLIKCILGLLEPDEGEILLDGQNILKLSRRRRQELMSSFGMLFQGGALFDSMKVWENVAFGLIQGQGMSRKEAQAIANEKLTAVNLDKHIGNQFPAELSGGMQKRVGLARAIAGNPEAVFFDEPTTGLDPITSGVINQLIRSCTTEVGVSAITITHDIPSMRYIGDRAALLFDGQIIWCGAVKDIDSSNNSYVRQFIGGLPDGPFTKNKC